MAWLALDPDVVVWERLDQPVDRVLSHRTAAALHGGVGGIWTPMWWS